MKKFLVLVCCVWVAASCSDNDEPEFFVNENPATFKEIGIIDIGDVGAAEISAYDPQTKKLFVVNNAGTAKVDVIDIANPAAPTLTTSINLTSYAGAANSVAVKDGLLAIAIETVPDKQAPGKVLVFNTSDLKEVKQITVGALPDMVTFTPDGAFILTANEGEPSTDYTNDPEGSVSIISVKENYSVSTLNFAAFASQQATLTAKGFRIFGLNATFAKDVEPEYIAVSSDSKKAWVTLQENNGIAEINLVSRSIVGITPLGFKDFNAAGNAIDVSDQDGVVSFKNWNVKGIYQPDGIDVFEVNGGTYLITANEGDAREYGTAFVEARRLGNSAYVLDATKFPNAATLKQNTQLGRLNVTTATGDTDGDKDFDEIYTFGARSFTIWNSADGSIVYDSKNELDVKAQEAGVYDDGRSDDKGAEPEGVAVGKVGNQMVAFIGLERADAVAIYDVTNPAFPVFLQLLKSGDAPEGILYIPAKDSPIQKSLLIVSSENDGTVRIYQPDTIL
jgi:hypothetical protein